MSRGYMLRSKRDDWRTPPEVIDVVREAFRGSIDLDPCGNRYSLVGAKKQLLLSKGEDGLVTEWKGRTFVNPPFSSGKLWLAKAASSPRAETILLMPARVDTKAFHEHGVKADAVAFWKGRITFVGAPASAPFPVMFLYWGAEPNLFVGAFSRHAAIYTLTLGVSSRINVVQSS